MDIRAGLGGFALLVILGCLGRFESTDQRFSQFNPNDGSLMGNAPSFQGSTLGGVVLAKDSGQPLSSVMVRIFNNAYYFESNKYTYTDLNGNWNVSGIADGVYYVYFDSHEATPRGYAPEFYDGKGEWETATPITVSNSVITNVNASLLKGGVITGRVTDKLSGDGLRVSVEAISPTIYANSSPFGIPSSDVNGYYTLTGLATGNVYVRFGKNSDEYLQEYYNNAFLLADASPISVKIGETIQNVDVTLVKGGILTGRVTDEETGETLEQVWVELYNQWC